KSPKSATPAAKDRHSTHATDEAPQENQNSDSTEKTQTAPAATTLPDLPADGDPTDAAASPVKTKAPANADDKALANDSSALAPQLVPPQPTAPVQVQNAPVQQDDTPKPQNQSVAAAI